MVRRVLALCAALIAVCAAAAGPASARVPLEIGISADYLLLNGDPAEADRAIARWRDLGIDTVRVQVQWSRVTPNPADPLQPDGFNPLNPDDIGYHWGVYDNAINKLVAAGLKPILLLGGPPPLWASSVPEQGSPRREPAAWQFAAFAQAVAQRYGAIADRYILWNEPNLPLWLQPQARCVKKKCSPISPHLYRHMTRAAYTAIHAADATSTVLIGALAPTGSRLRSRNANMRPLTFLRALGCVDRQLRPLKGVPECAKFAPAMADGIAYHPHSTKQPPDEPYEHRDDAHIASLRTIERLIDGMQARGRLLGSATPLPLWLDEYAYQTNPPDKLRGVTPGRQDRYLQQAAYLAWRNPRVNLLAQYLWHDEPVGGDKRYTGWQSGLLGPDGTPKPALEHFDDPFWVDLERNVLWGQIRPGGAHDVEVQIRLAGAGTEWTSLGRLRTAEDGTWVVNTKLVPFAAYRVIWDGTERTATHVAMPSTADLGGTKSELVERRTVAPVAGGPVPASFAGMSIEWRSIPDYLGSGGVPNAVFGKLVQTLARTGNGAPTLRFGGDSTDHTWWNPEGRPKPTGIVTDITPAWLNDLALWQSRTHTPLIMGLNLGLNDAENAATLASSARGALPPGSVKAFEIGNEPDLYATPRAYAVGKNRLVRLAKRPNGYSYGQYRDELDAYAARLGQAVPDVPLVAGSFAGSSWDDHAYDLLGHRRDVKTYGAHSYPLSTCEPEIRRAGGEKWIPKLLGRAGFTPIIARMRPLVAAANSQGAEVRMTEMNSAICGGLRGMSDSLASALWGADILFGLAEAGVKSVAFHTWTGSWYGPVEPQTRGGRRGAHVRPLYYGMLLFNRATPPGSRLLAVGPNPPSAPLKTWGTVDRAGTRRIVAINKDIHNERQVLLSVPRGARRGSVERLTGPSIKTRYHVKLAGQGYGPWTGDGALKGKRKTEALIAKRGTFRLRVPAGSAALVTIAAR